MEEYILAENKYGKYAVPKSCQDRPAAQMIIKGDVYEPETIRFLLDNGGDGIIIHAGTFFGDFLPALMQSGKKVYTFEPVRENYEHARETIDINDYPDHRVLLYNVGLGAVVERRDIMTVSHSGTSMGGMSRYVFEGAKPEQLEGTSVMTLDRYVTEYENVSIIQLDVEGFEEEALKGAIEIIRSSKPVLILECWSPTMFDTVFFQEEIFSMGYTRGPNLHDNATLII